jgi:hypothetical protein
MTTIHRLCGQPPSFGRLARSWYQKEKGGPKAALAMPDARWRYR